MPPHPPDQHYIDHNATTPIRGEVINAVAEAMAQLGNASAVHAYGRKAKAKLEQARAQVAALVGAPRAQDVIFTASGTEANNMAVRGFPQRRFRPLASEHAAVLQARESAVPLSLAPDGRIASAAWDSLEADDLLACQLANNETGVLQDAELLAQAPCHLHVDAVQAVGKIPVSMTQLGCQSLALSAHKFGGPQGVAALIIQPGLDMPALILGGGQERRRRGGTENLAGIVGMGVAAQLALRDLSSYAQHTRALRDAFERGLPPSLTVVGQGAPRLPNTSCVLFPGKRAETLLMQFDLAGIAVSAGAACSSGKVGASHVLTAMGYSAQEAGSALRFSFGRTSGQGNVDAALALIRKLR